MPRGRLQRCAVLMHFASPWMDSQLRSLRLLWQSSYRQLGPLAADVVSAHVSDQRGKMASEQQEGLGSLFLLSGV